MSSLKYWEHRQAQRMFEYMQSAEDTADEVSKLYQKASGYISRELDRIFERYKRKHHLTDAEAYRLLNTLRDKTSLDELKKALKAPGRGQTAQDLLAELESPAYQARLERLQQLQNQIDRTMLEVYRQEKAQNTRHYLDLANEAYYKSLFDIQQRAGFGFSFSAIDPKVIDRVINSKWSGLNYSERIWHNTRSLAQTLKEELLVNLITGRTDREAAEIIANKYAQGASKARRLVRTESCNLANQIEMLSYEECGIETYIYVATLDLRTSEECRRLDGKHFPVAEQQPGKNCPPMHPWCRSTTICDISAEELAQMKRRARDPETGKTYEVPADMKYKEWKKVLDDGGDFASWKKSEKPIEKESGSGIIKLSDTKEVADVHLIGKIDREIYKCITNDIVTDEVIITDERIQHIIDRRGKEFYEKYGDKFISILQEPDFIFKDKENTALVCKEFEIDNKYVNLALRLVVLTDNPGYKNSIITAVGESAERFGQRLRNNDPLYKKE